jgi:hypothetical protein
MTMNQQECRWQRLQRIGIISEQNWYNKNKNKKYRVKTNTDIKPFTDKAEFIKCQKGESMVW